MKTIAIAGASGFVGKHLIELLLARTDWNIRALSRGSRESNHPRITWIKADLFSVLDIEKGLGQAEVAVYLVHSMQPSAHLDQGNFADYDLILADNFGRACKKLGVQHALYLGGLIPKRGDISRHLASRLEVEKVLKQYLPHTTIFRAALILGAENSGFQILLRLVKRLPVMICPRWTEMPTSPVHVDKVSQAVLKALGNQAHYEKTYDLCSSNEMSYFELLEKTSLFLGLKRKFIRLRGSFIHMSKLWVRFLTGAPKRLVYPLLDSLENEMTAAPDKMFPKDELSYESVEEALARAIEQSRGNPYSFKERVVERKTVRSVQRSVLPLEMSAEDVAREYIVWLPKALRPFLIVKVDDHFAHFSFLFSRFRLLSLRWSPERSEKNRQLFYIAGGALAAPQDRGRLEFREVLNKKYMLAAIHDFYPALPWYVYVNTQALAHLIVMKLFGRHLKLIAQGKRKWIQKSRQKF